MIQFIRNYSLKNIRNKLLILYLLNVTDIIFTLILLNTGFYMEANILMSRTVKSLIMSFITKIIFPGILFSLIYYRIQKASDKQLRQSNLIISGAIIFYLLINISHIICFTLLPFLLYFN